MPTDPEAPDIDDVYVDASLREHAKAAIVGFQQQGIFPAFRFDTKGIQRVHSPLTDNWEFTVGYRFAEDLPIVQAGISVLPGSFYESTFVRLTHTIRTHDKTFIRLMLQNVPGPYDSPSPIASMAVELIDPDVQSQKIMGVSYTFQTFEKMLMYSSVSYGKPLFDPVKLRVFAPVLFNENELPPWGLTQSSLALFDDESALRLIQRWPKSLRSDMKRYSPEEAVLQLSSQIISA